MAVSTVATAIPCAVRIAVFTRTVTACVGPTLHRILIITALLAPARKERVDLGLAMLPFCGACRGVADCGADPVGLSPPVASSNAGRRPLFAAAAVGLLLIIAAVLAPARN